MYMLTRLLPAKSSASLDDHPLPQRRKRFSRPMFMGVIATLVVVLGSGAFFVVQKLTRSHAATDVNATAIVTAYWGGDQQKWSQLAQTHPAGTIAIANYDAGPPASGDGTFTQEVSSAHASGLKVIGYVATGKGGKALSEVQQKIDGWYAYQIDGIFLDEGSTDSGDLSFYQNIANYIRAKSSSGNTIVLNPGWVPSSKDYLNVADIIMAYEGPANELNNFPGASWMTDSSRFAAIVENVSSSQMSDVIQQSAQNHFGYVYTIPDSQNYGQLPDYWSQEASSLKGMPNTGMQPATHAQPGQGVQTQPKPAPAPDATKVATEMKPSCAFKMNDTTVTGCKGSVTISNQTCTFTVTNNVVTLKCPQNQGQQQNQNQNPQQNQSQNQNQGQNQDQNQSQHQDSDNDGD